MSAQHRRALAEGMRRSARERTCPVCARGAALVVRPTPERPHRVVCRWEEHGLCPPAAEPPAPDDKPHPDPAH